MTTPARLAANRHNALVSTGPQTVEGKAIACQNARTHGLLSRRVLLPDENGQQLASVRRHLYADLQPIGDLETLLVDRMVACAWRLRRLHAVERGVFQGGRDDEFSGAYGALGYAFLQASETFAKLARYEAALDRAFYRALHELQRLQAARAGVAVVPAVAVDVVTVATLDASEDAEDAEG